jgi:hypothetical protein
VDIRSGPIWAPDPPVREHPLNSGRLAWWMVQPPTDGGSQLLNLADPHNPATLLGFSGYGGWRPQAHPGGRGSLTMNSGARLNPAIVQAPASFSIGAWINQDTSNLTGYRTIYADSGTGFWLLNGKIDYYYSTDRSGSLTLPVNTWTRILVTYSTIGTKLTYWINGRQDATFTAGVALPTSGTVGIGGDPSDTFFGFIDDISLWSRSLAATEVWADYELSQAGYPGVLRTGPPRRRVRTTVTTTTSPVGLTSTATWDVRGKVGSTYASSWNIRKNIKVIASHKWDVDRPVGLVVSAVWADLIPVGVARNATWDVRTLARIAGNAPWRVRDRVGVEYTARWDHRVLASLGRSASWSLRGLVGQTYSASWDVSSFLAIWPVRIDGAIRWGMRRPVGVYSHTQFNTRNVSSLYVHVTWGVRAVAGVAGDVRFAILQAAQPGGISYDPAAAAAYIEAQHGLNAWGLIPAAGSVRIDHDYPIPDAMRATRGRGADGIPGVIIRIFDMNDYQSGLRQDPRDVQGRSVTGPDGRWLNDIYLIPGEYIILYEEAARFPVADYLTVVGPVPGREPPDLPPGDINNPYYELDRILSVSHGFGSWGPGQLRGPSPVDHHFGGVDRYTLTRNGQGLGNVNVEIYLEADFQAGRIGERYQAGWSRTNAAGRWDWPVNLYPGRYVAVGWHGGIATEFDIEVP